MTHKRNSTFLCFFFVRIETYPISFSPLKYFPLKVLCRQSALLYKYDMSLGEKSLFPLFLYKFDRTCNSFPPHSAPLLLPLFVFVFNRNPYCCCFAPKLASNLALNWLLAEVGQRFGQSNWRLYIDSYSMATVKENIISPVTYCTSWANNLQ